MEGFFFLNSFYKYISGSASFFLHQVRQASNSNCFSEVLPLLFGPFTTSLVVRPLILEMWGTPQGFTECALMMLSRHDEVSCNMPWETGLNAGEVEHGFLFLSATRLFFLWKTPVFHAVPVIKCFKTNTTLNRTFLY